MTKEDLFYADWDLGAQWVAAASAFLAAIGAAIAAAYAIKTFAAQRDTLIIANEEIAEFREENKRKERARSPIFTPILTRFSQGVIQCDDKLYDPQEEMFWGGGIYWEEIMDEVPPRDFVFCLLKCVPSNSPVVAYKVKAKESRGVSNGFHLSKITRFIPDSDMDPSDLFVLRVPTTYLEREVTVEVTFENKDGYIGLNDYLLLVTMGTTVIKNVIMKRTSPKGLI